MNHSFNVEVAKEVGILAATIFNNIGFWVDHNKANGRNYHDGRYWTYNSVRAFSEQFPYATEAQIAGALRKLRDADYVATGNYCEDKRDRSLWYTLSERGWVTFYGSAVDPQEECIPQNKEVHSTNSSNDYIDTDVNADAKPDTEQFRQVITYLNERTGRNYRLAKASRRLIAARFADGYTLDDFKRVIDNMVSRWKGTDWEQYLQPSTLFAASHFDDYLNKPVAKANPQPTGRLSEYNFANREGTETRVVTDDAYDWSGYDDIRF